MVSKLPDVKLRLSAAVAAYELLHPDTPLPVASYLAAVKAVAKDYASVHQVTDSQAAMLAYGARVSTQVVPQVSLPQVTLPIEPNPVSTGSLAPATRGTSAPGSMRVSLVSYMKPTL